jgi:hypothetical protein
MKKYIVVENAGHEDEFDVKVCSTAIAADRWIAKHLCRTRSRLCVLRSACCGKANGTTNSNAYS